MKNGILFLFISILTLSCTNSKDKNEVGPGSLNVASTFAKCKSEGISWENFNPKSNVSTMKVSYYPGSSRVLFSFELGEAGKSNGKRVFLNFGFAIAGKGKYNILPLPADDSVLYSYYGVDRLSVIEGGSGTGEVEITEHVQNDYITGKFHFNIAKDGKSSTVENGEFKVKVNF